MSMLLVRLCKYCIDCCCGFFIADLFFFLKLRIFFSSFVRFARQKKFVEGMFMVSLPGHVAKTLLILNMKKQGWL